MSQTIYKNAFKATTDRIRDHRKDGKTLARFLNLNRTK
jgi:hypothetical protein